MPSKQPYTVYASVWHISPPERRVKADYVLVFDHKGRLVTNLGGTTMAEYGGRYSKKAARQAVAFRVNSYGTSEIGEDDVKLISSDEAKKLYANSRRGGFQVFISIDNVPNEKTIYVRGIYLLEFGNIPWKKTSTLNMIRTRGEDDESGVKKVLIGYLKERYDYWVEPEEIHFLKEKDREKFEALTA